MPRAPVHIGELDQQVTFLRKTRTPDGSGGANVAPVAYAADVWAHVHAMSGGERERAGRLDASRMYLVVVRYRDDVKEDDVIRWNGRDLNVRFIRARTQRELYLQIEAELGVRV